jgi:hypothetical protein
MEESTESLPDFSLNPPFVWSALFSILYSQQSSFTFNAPGHWYRNKDSSDGRDLQDK